MSVSLEKAKELLKNLEVQTCKSPVIIAKRTLCIQQFLTETKKQIEIKA